MDIGSLSWWAAEVFTILLGDVTLQTHPVKRPFIFAGHGLHDSSQEGLGVEETCKPDAGWHVEVGNPALELSYALQQVSKP